MNACWSVHVSTRPLLSAGVLPKSEANAMEACICSQQGLLELQQQFCGMWQAGLAACIALAALLAAGKCNRDHIIFIIVKSLLEWLFLSQ